MVVLKVRTRKLPVRVTAIVKALSTLPKKTEVVLGFNDIPKNDFNTLVTTIERHRDIICRHGELSVFRFIFPASFYTPVLPPPLKSDIGFSFSSLHYLEHELHALNKVPADAKEWEMLTREAAKAFSVAEMTKFLQLRAEETRSPGGILILAFPSQSENDHRVWYGLGLAMRAAMMSAVADGLLDENVVLRHGASMGTRTVEQVHAALEQVKTTWSVESVFLKDVVHPNYARYLDRCHGASADEKNEAYVEFARTLVEMVYAVYHPFLLQAIRRTPGGVGNISPLESEGETKIIERLKHASLEYYCKHEMGSPFWMPYIYVKLVRK